ncbi:MAG TPA: carboxypeptidase-like regulatory domain-containing protein, partial [Verrucomicrobiae bacterium]|nr:carboxypeptidase-like regulatory domain-containing protein [Verrucomicrobiae bacterium]
MSDESGGAVAGAKVAIKNVATGDVREVTTNADGLYSAPNLLPGNYEVTVTATGFQTLVQKGITLTVGAEHALNFGLKVGQLNQTVTVSEVPPSVDTTSSTLSATVEQRTVVELPLNGRDWTQLATLQPGVISVRAQASTGATANRGNRGFGDQLADSGHRPNENTYRVDGININDYSNGAPGSVLGASLGVDAIQEFSVVTTNYTAEYGRTSGAVINAITKSGTNRFHGSGYFFDRDKVFDARNFFDGPTIPPFRRTQFGGSAGGPIMKDKTFIFGDYEGVRQGQTLSFSDLIPSAAARAGNLCSAPVPTATCTPHTVTIDSKVAPYLALWPDPATAIITGTSSNGDTSNIRTSGLKVLNENYFTIRVDHRISASDALNGSYFFDKAPQLTPDNLDNNIHQVFTKRQM